MIGTRIALMTFLALLIDFFFVPFLVIFPELLQEHRTGFTFWLSEHYNPLTFLVQAFETKTAWFWMAQLILWSYVLTQMTAMVNRELKLRKPPTDSKTSEINTVSPSTQSTPKE